MRTATQGKHASYREAISLLAEMDKTLDDVPDKEILDVALGSRMIDLVAKLFKKDIRVVAVQVITRRILSRK